MHRETSGNVWLGPNSGYGIGVKDSAGPHNLPTQTMAHQHLTPSGKNYDEKEGQSSEVYTYNEWQQLCPEELAFQSVAAILGSEHIAFAAENPGTPQAIIAAKLITAASKMVTVNKKANRPIAPDPERVEIILSKALESGNPIAHLDALI